MNVLVLSPGFPPTIEHFCTALGRRGATVLGVGDSPHDDLSPALLGALSEYVVLQLTDYDSVHRATAGLIARHGRIDHVVSHIEFWMELEASLRDDFNIPGRRLAATKLHRSKTGMASLFDAEGIPRPPGIFARDLASVREFVAEHSFPLILKPDTGAGSIRTFKIVDDAELEAAFATPVTDSIVQPFVDADIVTFDGLADGNGDIVFAIAHRYDTGIMQVVSGALDGHYYSLRAMPAGLAQIGERAVRAFNVKNHFFHLEFFDRPEGYVALEMNLRPPGGFTTDMMNYTCDFDVYDLWARCILGERLGSTRLEYERKFHVAHAGRRDGVAYALSHEELCKKLGATLVSSRRLPKELAVMQGNVGYLLRSPDLDELRAGIATVQRRIDATSYSDAVPSAV